MTHYAVTTAWRHNSNDLNISQADSTLSVSPAVTLVPQRCWFVCKLRTYISCAVFICVRVQELLFCYVISTRNRRGYDGSTVLVTVSIQEIGTSCWRCCAEFRMLIQLTATPRPWTCYRDHLHGSQTQLCETGSHADGYHTARQVLSIVCCWLSNTVDFFFYLANCSYKWHMFLIHFSSRSRYFIFSGHFSCIHGNDCMVGTLYCLLHDVTLSLKASFDNNFFLTNISHYRTTSLISTFWSNTNA